MAVTHGSSGSGPEVESEHNHHQGHWHQEETHPEASIGHNHEQGAHSESHKARVGARGGADRAHSDHSADHGARTDHTGHEEMFRRLFWISLVMSIPVLLYSPMLQMWLGFTMPTFPGSDWIGPIFAVVIFLYGGVPFLRMAQPEVRRRRPGMMTLISLAISVAFVYSLAALFLPGQQGFFWELVTLIDIMLLGHWIEMRSVRQASGALDALAKLMPDTAERIGPDGDTEEVPVNALEQGDRVLVRPGASIPVDGEVQEGDSDVTEALITGESRPVDKYPGSRVIAGTINGAGSLRVLVTATGDQTALAGIMRLVAQAQQSKSRTQMLADRAAGWLFYIALGVAAITAVAWIIAVGFNVSVIARVATVLVIACPHALGLAVPLVVAISTSLAAGNGILVRDRLAFEAARDHPDHLRQDRYAHRGTVRRGGHHHGGWLERSRRVSADGRGGGRFGAYHCTGHPPGCRGTRSPVAISVQVRVDQRTRGACQQRRPHAPRGRPAAAGNARAASARAAPTVR